MTHWCVTGILWVLFCGRVYVGLPCIYKPIQGIVVRVVAELNFDQLRAIHQDGLRIGRLVNRAFAWNSGNGEEQSQEGVVIRSVNSTTWAQRPSLDISGPIIDIHQHTPMRPLPDPRLPVHITHRAEKYATEREGVPHECFHSFERTDAGVQRFTPFLSGLVRGNSGSTVMLLRPNPNNSSPIEEFFADLGINLVNEEQPDAKSINARIISEEFWQRLIVGLEPSYTREEVGIVVPKLGKLTLTTTRNFRLDPTREYHMMATRRTEKAGTEWINLTPETLEHPVQRRFWGSGTPKAPDQQWLDAQASRGRMMLEIARAAFQLAARKD